MIYISVGKVTYFLPNLQILLRIILAKRLSKIQNENYQINRLKIPQKHRMKCLQKQDFLAGFKYLHFP